MNNNSSEFITEFITEFTEISKTDIQKSWTNYLSNNDVPTATVIEITNCCPNNCAHCYANLSIGKNTTEMSTNIFNNWLNTISEREDKPEQIWLVGGEPTKHHLLKEFLQKTRETGFQPMIVTTGESFADKEYCKEIAPNADEIDITIRGSGAFHDLMMKPAYDELLMSIPKDISVKDQIKLALEKTDSNPDSDKHFQNTLQGLINISETIRETNSNTKIGLNVDIQATTDLYNIITSLKAKNIPIENIILQVQTFSDDNMNLENILPNAWRKPTTEIIEEYYRQAKELFANNIYTGNIEIIDPLPQEILDELKKKGIELGSLYNPVATPAIGPDGILRPNVIKELK